VEARTNPDQREGEDLTIHLIKVMSSYRRMIFLTTLAFTGVAILLGGLYYFWWQATRWSASLGFRPTFAGAETGTYPNGLPFSPEDVTSTSVLDDVFDLNNIESYCLRDEFRGGFFVDRRSAQLNFLDLEYQTRLADARLTTVDRERLQAEYRARRAGVPIEYLLTFVPSRACQSIPPAVVSKVLDDGLSTWANEMESKRGVLRLRVQVLTPNIFELDPAATQTLFTKAVLIRSALNRSIANVRNVSQLPGAELARFGDRKVSLAEIELRLMDLIQARYEPLVALSGGAFGRDAVRLVEESLATSNVTWQAAEARTLSYLTALREYSGQSLLSGPAQRRDSETGANTSDVQSLTPQIDRTFVDRIVEMSEANTTFRQEITRSMVDNSVKAVESKADVDYYQKLLSSLKKSSIASPSREEVDQQLNEIVTQAKAVMEQFNGLYEEFSRVALKPASVMYRIERPTQIVVAVPFSLRQYMLVVLSTFVVTLFAGALAAIAHDRFRQSQAGLPDRLPSKIATKYET
jgi:hypothetical protein